MHHPLHSAARTLCSQQRARQQVHKMTVQTLQAPSRRALAGPLPVGAAGGWAAAAASGGGARAAAAAAWGARSRAAAACSAT